MKMNCRPAVEMNRCCIWMLIWCKTCEFVNDWNLDLYTQRFWSSDGVCVQVTLLNIDRLQTVAADLSELSVSISHSIYFPDASPLGWECSKFVTWCMKPLLISLILRFPADIMGSWGCSKSVLDTPNRHCTEQSAIIFFIFILDSISHIFSIQHFSFFNPKFLGT